MSNPVWQSTSSNDFSSAGNYSGNTAPVTGDVLTLNGIGTAAISSGLGYGTNLMGFTLDVKDTFTSTIGVENSGTNSATYLKSGTSGASTAYFGRSAGGGVGGGSSMILFDFNTPGGVANIYKTGAPTGTYPPLCLLGTGVTVNAYGGNAGFAVRPGEVGTLTALALLANDQNAPPIFRVGKGTQFPSTVRVDAGTLYNSGTNGITTLKVSGQNAIAVSELEQTGTLATVTLTDGGKLIHKGTGALTSVSVGNSCTLDMTQDARSKNLDGVTAYKGAKVLLDNGVSTSITHSAGGTNVPIITCPDGIGTVTITAPAGMALKIQ